MSVPIPECKFYIFDGSFMTVYIEKPGARDVNGMPNIWYAKYLECVNFMPFPMQMKTNYPREKVHAITKCIVDGIKLIPKHNFAHRRGATGYKIVTDLYDGDDRYDISAILVWAFNRKGVDIDDALFYMLITRARATLSGAELICEYERICREFTDGLDANGRKRVTRSDRGYDFDAREDTHSCVIGGNIHAKVMKRLGIPPENLPPMSSDVFDAVREVVSDGTASGIENFKKYYGDRLRERLNV